MSRALDTLQDKEGDSSYRAPRMNDFEILGRAGDGTFSTVVKGRYRGDGHVYAVKIVDKYFVTKHRQTHRLVLERAVLDRLSDDGIVKLCFTFQDAQNLYFVMEHLSGGELFAQIRQKKRLDMASCQFYAAEVVLILEALRAERLVHRDLKPENLMLTAEGHLKLVDFGCVKDLNAVSETATGRTASFVGTAEYVPPETLNNWPITEATDLWGLGCLVFQMLAGTPPFKDRSEYLSYQRIARVEYTFPETFPALGRDLVTLLLVEDPTQRLGAADLAALKEHSFFDGIDWGNLRKTKPPAWIPPKPSDVTTASDLDWELKSFANPFERNVAK